uniref:tRNA uridine(34) hydroxylase n=1 Tax=uncultured bacterium W5-15b TaxID=1130997 RepID=H9BX03_9BACT|nr:rhodanese domain-containing protein [uncultured bacterium W5-15b]
MKEITIVSLYKFVNILDTESFRKELLAECKNLAIKGTFIIASEGINGTIAGTGENIESVIQFLECDNRFADIECKYSFDNKIPFYRMKVKIKDELIPIGVDGVDPREIVGTYVSPKEWNKLVEDPEVLLIDVRNQYEIEVGSFKGALNPETDNFRYFPEFVENNLEPDEHRKVAMFCTGGIRCEKASSYMLSKGFKEVFHLKGGILKYLEDVPKEKSLWDGECFVFDNRASVDHDLQNGIYDLCHNCRFPVSPEDMESEYFVKGISCPRCHDSITPERRTSLEERNRQIRLAKERNQSHLGVNQRRKTKIM